MNVYNLSRNFWNWAFENPDKIKPNHSALYFFAIEHCNRLGWKEKFGFPTSMAMEAVGIKSYNTFITTLKELVDYGFVKMIEKSKNQYSANIIALSEFDKADDKALDEAMIKHTTKQSESTVQSTSESIDSINKQTYNTTNIQTYKSTEAEASNEFSEKETENPQSQIDDTLSVNPETKEAKKVAPKKVTEILHIPEDFISLWNDWTEYRKLRKFKPYAGLKYEQMAVDKLLELSGCDPIIASKILQNTFTNNYQGFFPLKENQNGNSNTAQSNSNSGNATGHGFKNTGKVSARTVLAKRLADQNQNKFSDSDGRNFTVDAEIVN